MGRTEHENGDGFWRSPVACSLARFHVDSRPKTQQFHRPHLEGALGTLLASIDSCMQVDREGKTLLKQHMPSDSSADSQAHKNSQSLDSLVKGVFC